MTRSTAIMLRNVRIAAAYVAAFKEANGKEPYVSYDNGWFTVLPSRGKFRAKQIIAMTNLLKSRAK